MNNTYCECGSLVVNGRCSNKNCEHHKKSKKLDDVKNRIWLEEFGDDFTQEDMGMEK